MSLRNSLTAFAVAPFFAGAAIACPQYDAVVRAVSAGDAAEATRLHEVIAVSPECDDALREWVGDYLARESFLAAHEASTADAKRDALTRALRFETHWRSYAELGRLDWSEKNYASAANHLQLAINELAEGDPNHAAETAEIAEIYELATASLALADDAVSMPKTRSGEIGGVFKTAIRGFSVEEVQLPITFEYNSTEFDNLGVTYAQALVEHLGILGADHIFLGGHTDPIGGETFNMDLSLARAEALGSFLKSNGFNGQIDVKGYGESQFPSPPPGVKAGSEEHHRIARRVAFRAE